MSNFTDPKKNSSSANLKPEKKGFKFPFIRKTSSATNLNNTPNIPENLTSILNNSNNNLNNNNEEDNSALLTPRSRSLINQSPRLKLETSSLEGRIKEMDSTNNLYKSCQNGYKDFIKESVNTERTEQFIGQQLINLGNNISKDDEYSKHVKFLSDQFGANLKAFATARKELNRDIEEKYLRLMNDVILDNEKMMKQAFEDNFIEAEVEYELQYRNTKYFLMLNDLKNSFTKYYDNCSKLMVLLNKQLDSVINQQIEHSIFTFPNQLVSVTSLQNGWNQQTLNEMLSNYFPTREDETVLFGVDLRIVLKRFNEPFGIPKRIKELIEFIENNYLEIEGLFRVPGHSKGIDDLADRIDQGEIIDWSTMELINKPHTICGLLKKYTRSLPEPLLTFDLFDKFIEVAKLYNSNQSNSSEIGKLLKPLIDKLPLENFNLLGRLVQLFKRITSNEGKTKMSPSNLARSFGTNLLKLKEGDDQRMMMELERINIVCEMLIVHCDELFIGPLDTKLNQKRKLKADEIEKLKNSTSSTNNNNINNTNNISPNIQENVISEGSDDEESEQTNDGNNNNNTSIIVSSPSNIPPLSLGNNNGETLKRWNSMIEQNNLSGSDSTVSPIQSPKSATTVTTTTVHFTTNDPNLEVQSKRESLQGWIEILDKSRKKYYYFNPSTNKTSWKHPLYQTRKELKEESTTASVTGVNNNLENTTEINTATAKNNTTNETTSTTPSEEKQHHRLEHVTKQDDSVNFKELKFLMDCIGFLEQQNYTPKDFTIFLISHLNNYDGALKDKLKQILQDEYQWKEDVNLTIEQLEKLKTTLQELAQNYL
ncbi:hypothetical protein ABK040_007765 [Willaertia magna]